MVITEISSLGSSQWFFGNSGVWPWPLALRACLQFHFTWIRYFYTDSQSQNTQNIPRNCLKIFVYFLFQLIHFQNTFSSRWLLLCSFPSSWLSQSHYGRRGEYSFNVDSNKREMLSGVRLLFFPPTRLKTFRRPEIILWFPHLQPARDVKWPDIHNQTLNVALIFFFNLFSKSKCTLTVCMWFWEEEKQKVQEK